MKRVYLASPFFNDEENTYVDKVEQLLKEKGLHVWSPRDNQFNMDTLGQELWSIKTFSNDIKHIDWCECVVAIYGGNYMDSGTAFEIGYAYATNKPILLVHVGENSNLMCHEAAHANLTIEQLENFDFEKFPSNNYTGKMF